jgi:hypothetical protein
MKLSTFAAGLFSLSLIVAACSSSDSNGGGGTGGTGAGGSGTGGSSAGGSGAGGSGAGGSSAGGTSGDAGGGATTYADVKSIFVAKCTPCHAAGGIGATAHTLADSAADATKTSYFCAGKKKGECALIRVKAGSMPYNAGCKGDPQMDSANPKCLTQAEQDKLQAWIDGGLK